MLSYSAPSSRAPLNDISSDSNNHNTLSQETVLTPPYDAKLAEKEFVPITELSSITMLSQRRARLEIKPPPLNHTLEALGDERHQDLPDPDIKHVTHAFVQPPTQLFHERLFQDDDDEMEEIRPRYLCHAIIKPNIAATFAATVVNGLFRSTNLRIGYLLGAVAGNVTLETFKPAEEISFSAKLYKWGGCALGITVVGVATTYIVSQVATRLDTNNTPADLVAGMGQVVGTQLVAKVAEGLAHRVFGFFSNRCPRRPPEPTNYTSLDTIQHSVLRI